MKNEIQTNIASRLTSCGTLIMVTAGYQGLKTITPCAWHMPVSKEPPIVSVALSKKHFSSELIGKSKEFAINVPGWKLLDKVLKCAKASGRTMNKFKYAGLTEQKAETLKDTSLIKECIANIECKLVEMAEKGDHYIFYGEITKAIAEQDYFVNDMWDTSKVDLIFHIGGKCFSKSTQAITA